MVVPIPPIEHRPEDWLNSLSLVSGQLSSEESPHRKQAKRRKTMARLPALSLRPVNPHLHVDLIQMSQEVAADLGTASPALYEITENRSNVLLSLLFCSPDIILIDFDFFKRLTPDEQKAMIAHELQHSNQSMNWIGAIRKMGLHIEGLMMVLERTASPLAKSLEKALSSIYSRCSSYIERKEAEADEAALALTDIHTLTSATAKTGAYILEKWAEQPVEIHQSAIGIASQLDAAFNRQRHPIARLTGDSLAERLNRLDAIAKEQTKTVTV